MKLEPGDWVRLRGWTLCYKYEGAAIHEDKILAQVFSPATLRPIYFPFSWLVPLNLTPAQKDHLEGKEFFGCDSQKRIYAYLTQHQEQPHG